MDILVSGSAILLLSPVYILAGLAVKLTTPGPIIFRQMRAGRGGKPFAFYKFRSMYIDAEARRAALADQNQHDNGPIFKMKNDPRITPVGKFLRKTSIDELPQLFNVLKGDMTLIGPRPPMLSEVEKYDLWQRKRLDMTGGITCIWQVSGRSEIKFDDWVRMDIQYQQKRSLWFDLKLLFKTIGAVVSGRGAY
ncbi:MAG: sugar transferase [Planctomycetota bacterium]